MAGNDDTLFDLRWRRSEADLLQPFRLLYGAKPEAEARLKAVLRKAWEARPEALKALDLERDLMPDWFLSEKMVGYVFYVDRFARTLNGIHDRLDYLQSLGVTYIHLMPCLKPRPGPNDGGYSVEDYRAIDPRLGTMADFEKLTAALRERGMSVCVDLVLNHTAKEHDWAKKAQGGDKKYQAYYGCSTRTTNPRHMRKRSSKFSPPMRRAISRITPTSVDGCGRPSMSTSGI
jgi:amylosucrase